MFNIHKKPQGDAAVKKSVQKILDPKKDIVTRLKHLKLVLENVTDPAEEHAIFEQYYSHIYYVFYENFLIAESNVRQKGAHRAQREELDGMLQIFETILTHLPDMIHERWQYNSIDRIIKSLLHPCNSLKLRRDGVKLFLLWFRALREHAEESTNLLFALLIPGFPTPKSIDPRFKDAKLESLLNPAIENPGGMCPAEITFLVPTPAGEKPPDDLTRYFLDAVLQFMVVEAFKLQWKDEATNKVCFTFLWDMFKKHYLGHIFQDFRYDMSLYQPDLSLPEPREPIKYVFSISETGSIDQCITVAAGCPMLSSRVLMIKWIVIFTSNAVKEEIDKLRSYLVESFHFPDHVATPVFRSIPVWECALCCCRAPQTAFIQLTRSSTLLDGLSTLMQQHQRIVTSVIGLPDKPIHSQVSLPLPSSVTQEQEGSNSNASTLTDKAPSMSSLSSLDDKYKFCATGGEGEMVREVLYSTRENVNIVHEIFRQALMLPLTESKTMRRVIKAYQEWIQDGYTPVFMEVPDISNENDPSQDELGELSDSDEEMRITRRPSGSSLRNISYMRGQLNPMIDEARSTQVRAGSQTTYQLFITNSAHTFLVEPPTDAHKLVQAQVDVCKRVLNIYRHMVMHVNMDNVTWTQLLQVLLHITKIMLQDQDSPFSIRVTTVAGHLSGPVFQTLIVSWIKANLFVHVSRELWDELVDVLSSLMHWKELIIEWTKNMDTMTRVLARHVYGLELSDLPLDRLTEQKQMRNRRVIVKEKAAKGAEKSFSKGWGKDANSATSEKSMMKMRSQTAVGGGIDQPDGKIVSARDSDDADQDKIPVQRKRSNTVLGLESTTDKDMSLKNISTSNTEKNGRPPLKRGASDTSDLSSSPPLVNNLLNIAGSKNDSLYRSSSTSDISTEKLASKGLPGTDLEYGQGMRQRCNSGPGVRERAGKGETVHGLALNPTDNDGVASLSGVEDAFNDMFDELAQQRLSLTLTTSKFEWNMQQEVDSIKSQDSGSIDPSWNPFGEPNCASIVEDPVADQYFDARRESKQLDPSDFRDEEEWGSCLEDSNFGDACGDEERSSSDDSTESSDELDYSSTTGTLYRTESYTMSRTLEKIPSSVTNALLDAITAPATRPRTLTLHEFSPAMANILTDPTPTSIPWERYTHPPVRKSFSSPGISTSILSIPVHLQVKRTNSSLLYTEVQRELAQGVSAPKKTPSPELTQPSLRIDTSHHTFPRTKLSSSRRVIEPLATTNENSLRYCIEIPRSMPHSPSDHVDGMLPPCTADPPLQDEKANDNHPVSMLTNEKNSSEATVQLSSPPYQIYQHGSRDRYDSTALLIPESHTKSKTGAHDSILEEEDTASDCPDTELEKSSDDILEMQCNNAQLSIIRQASVVGSDGTSEGDEDALALQNKTDSLLTPSEDCSILAGGRRTGWYPEVAVALWRRLLGVLGDVNKIEDPVIHQLVFTYLLKFYDVLFKIRENLGIASDNLSTPAPPVLVPPTRIMSPWAFKAVLSAPESHKGGCLHAYQLLCKSTLQHHDTRLEPEHLALFYMVLHEGLHSNQDKVNEIVESSSPKVFSCCLPASTLLLLDYIYACHSVAASADPSSPRVEAQTILGSVLCFPNLYFDVPVLNPDSTDPQSIVCNNIKEYVADALLTSAKKEPSAPARCVALSSLGVWLYEELTSPVDENNLTPAAEGSEGFCYDNNFSPVKGRILARHGRVKEAINVLLVSLKFNNRAVASVACSQLHLLTHCITQLLEYMPDVPLRIIEVMSLTASQLLQNSEAKSSDSGRRLLVSLLLCICDWCMVVPLSMLIDTTLPGSDKRLIRTVFKALQTGALGKPGHSAKHSYSLSDLATQDFDPNLQLDKVLENINHSSSIRNNKLTLPPKPSLSLGTDNVVSLTASTVLNHLTNHLGHFPLSKGPSVLNSMITEHQDHGNDQNQTSDLSNNLFYSPNVQFLIYNDTCLLSMVEIPSQNETIRGLSTSSTNVRLIVRDTSGKFCWDSSILYGSKSAKEQTNQVSIVPLSTLHQDVSKVILEHCHLYLSYVEEELQKKRLVLNTLLPSSNSPLQVHHACDKLDQLLQYVGFSSPECQEYPGRPLNIPGHGIEEKIEDKALEYLLQQNKNQCNNYSSNSAQKSCQSKPARPPLFSAARSAFHQSRLLISQTAFLSKENRRRVTLLKKNERLFRELKNLDSRGCRETHKVAVIYIAPGQEDKLSILSNTAGSHDFESFVSGLGWEVDLKTHCGFKGKLNSDGSTGNTCPYYATSTLEVVFHVSTRFPSTNNDSRNIKLKHLGNDEVHIVWSEHGRDYRRGIIPTEFGDVLIIIYPIKHRLYRIQIKKKDEIPYFGPLFDGAIVNARVLPVLVRETAINAGRAKRSQLSLYQPFYEERAKYLRQIIDQFRDDTTFEAYASQLFSPGQSVKTTPASKTSMKKSAPQATPTVPVHVETNVTQISASPLVPSPVMNKTVPVITPQSALVNNNINTNNNNVLSPVLEDLPSMSNYQKEEMVPASPPPVKDPPSPEKEAGPKYTPGHIVSGNKPFHSPSSTTNPLHILSSKFSGTHLISTPRPKPSGSHSSSMSSLFSNKQHHQQAPLQPTAIPDSTKIHIPVSKMHSSKFPQSLSQRRQTSTPVKVAPPPTAGILLSPPPSAAKSSTNHHTNPSLSSSRQASPLRVQNSGR